MQENSMDGLPSRRKLCAFPACSLKLLNKDGDFAKIHDRPVSVVVWSGSDTECSVDIQDGDQSILNFIVSRETGSYHAGERFYIFNLKNFSPMICFPKKQDVIYFSRIISESTGTSKESVFSERTEESSAVQYFQFYGYLSQQQNMMQDYIRTSTYQKAMLQNEVDFKDKVVLDVGAGTGILSFFAIQSGARKVYAVEASTMAVHCETLAKANGLKEKLHVIAGKLEEIEIPEKVDMIISEPMGYMLVNERMLESFLHAKKWLKPEGNMFPSQGNLYVAPFMDDALYMEHYSKANFWFQPSFYGVNLTQLREKAVEEYFKQPIVDTFDVQILLAKPITHTINFLTSAEEDLHRIHIPLNFTALTAGNVHGLAFWFDVAFLGTTRSVWLSTAPQEPLTHWYQVRCLLPHPLHVRAGQILRGHVLLVANKKQSYDVEIEMTVDGSNIISRNVLDLKNPYFRYTGAQTSPPTGSNTTSPTETYWSSIPNNVGSSLNIVNHHELTAGGVLSNGVVPSNAGYGMSGVNALGLQGQVLASGGVLMNNMQTGYIVGNHGGQYNMQHGGSAYGESVSASAMQR